MENQKILTGSGASGKKKVRKAVQNTLAMLAACIVLTLMVYPLIYTVLNSLKSFEDFLHIRNIRFRKPCTLKTIRKYLKIILCGILETAY